MVGGTVKQFKDALEEMRSIYNFDYDRTRIDLRDPLTHSASKLTIITMDERTQTQITMEKSIPYIPFEQ